MNDDETTKAMKDCINDEYMNRWNLLNQYWSEKLPKNAVEETHQAPTPAKATHRKGCYGKQSRARNVRWEGQWQQSETKGGHSIIRETIHDWYGEKQKQFDAFGERFRVVMGIVDMGGQDTSFVEVSFRRFFFPIDSIQNTDGNSSASDIISGGK